ncbi:hypothetical protein TWF481_004233 [Arthrobotrys musiformis]|uniref:Translation initiation factor 3 C-terminal domain-containing protein n=1 Tax=Arthrobotrys musiformis TaxID=47236 RepID=A0AAV9WIW8_9PEZI
MALRQITKATCRNLNRPTLSLLSIYTTNPAYPPPPSFLLPPQRRTAVTTATRFPVAPNLGPQFISESRVRFPYDDEITAHNPTYIDEKGALVGVYPIAQILRAYDRSKYHLIHISGVDRLTDESEGHIVRLFPKSLLLERLEAERRAEMEENGEDIPGFKKKKKKSGRDITKEVQISWGIDRNDLSTHLKKIGRFLEKGNTVEVMIARKKKQGKPTQGKLDEMMEVIEEFMYYNGGEEVRKRSGEIGGQLTMAVQRPEDWVVPPPRPKAVEKEEPIDEAEFEKLQMEKLGTAAGEGGVSEGVSEGVEGNKEGKKKHVPAWQARGEVS